MQKQKALYMMKKKAQVKKILEKPKGLYMMTENFSLFVCTRTNTHI